MGALSSLEDDASLLRRQAGPEGSTESAPVGLIFLKFFPGHETRSARLRQQAGPPALPARAGNC